MQDILEIGWMPQHYPTLKVTRSSSVKGGNLWSCLRQLLLTVPVETHFLASIFHMNAHTGAFYCFEMQFYSTTHSKGILQPIICMMRFVGEKEKKIEFPLLTLSSCLFFKWRRVERLWSVWAGSQWGAGQMGDGPTHSAPRLGPSCSKMQHSECDDECVLSNGPQRLAAGWSPHRPACLETRMLMGLIRSRLDHTHTHVPSRA